MMQRHYRPTPPGGTVPVVVPGDVVLVREPGLVVWAGAVTVFPEGFQFTLLTLFDTSRVPPADFALDVPDRGRMTWLEVRFADGRRRGVDLNANTPPDQPQRPQVTMQDGVWADGWFRSMWWVTPLPPPGAVELVIHLGGADGLTGSGLLDGARLTEAASRADVVWPQADGANGPAGRPGA
ncbi:MAG TPA: hypothetical protein VGI31_00330 [Streptosporangiaceae bacterium]